MSMFINTKNSQAVSEASFKSKADEAGSAGKFRSAMAKALSGAAGAASLMAPAKPVAGAVAAGFQSLSNILDSEASHAASKDSNLEEILDNSQSINARYIELQARMQMESQAFTTVSNIMKARHESAQTAINNIR